MRTYRQKAITTLIVILLSGIGAAYLTFTNSFKGAGLVLLLGMALGNYINELAEVNSKLFLVYYNDEIESKVESHSNFGKFIVQTYSGVDALDHVKARIFALTDDYYDHAGELEIDDSCFDVIPLGIVVKRETYSSILFQDHNLQNSWKRE
jgi:hypothetical protein